MTDDERQQLVDEFEAARAPGLRIADAAATFKARTADLEWSLSMTDPATAGERQQGVGFNQGYADRRLEQDCRAWREARDGLQYAIENGGDRVRPPVPKRPASDPLTTLP
jgi:hypothetical protein